MLGLGVVLCALGLPTGSHHKSHTPDSDAAAPPGHALPASAKSHAVSKHKAVKHTAKSHANSHAAKGHAKHRAKIHKDHVVQHAAAEASAKGHLPPVPKDFVALKDNSQISWEVLELGPDDCMPPTCEPGMRCAEFNQVETDALVYSNLANKGPNNNCQENPIPNKLECESCPYDEAAEPGVWAESGHCSVTGIRVNRAGKNKDGVEFDYIIDLQEGSEYPVLNPARNELSIAAQGEAMLQINLKVEHEVRAPLSLRARRQPARAIAAPRARASAPHRPPPPPSTSGHARCAPLTPPPPSPSPRRRPS